MSIVPRPCRPVIRVLTTTTLLSGGLLLAAVPMNAARAETCDLTGEPGTIPIDARRGRVLITVLHDASGHPGGAVAPQLMVAFAPDGSARAHGVIHLLDTDPPAVLVATGQALVIFDERGINGLTLEGWHPDEARVGPPIDINLVAHQPIAASGVHEIDLTVGATTLTGVRVFVAFLGPCDVTAVKP